MHNAPTAWTPDVAVRLAVLRSEITKNRSVERSIDGTPVECFLGMEEGGNIWLRVTCDPESVSVDLDIASIEFKKDRSGYRVVIAPGAAAIVVEHLLEEMIHLLRSGHPPGDIGRAALRNWRELLARPAGAPLGEKALVGLFGELEVLELVLQCGGSLEHWTGWNQDHCDFRLPGLVVEVKTTTSANYRRVQIHGLGQLADPEDGSDLVLVLKRLEPSPGGRSLPDLIESVVALGASRSGLLERLACVGYSEVHRQRYEHATFVGTDVALRRIDDSHPRLVPSMLEGVDLSSIDKIDYELNLNGDAAADLDADLGSLLSDRGVTR